MVTRARIVLTSLLVLMFSGSIALAQEYGPASGRPAFAQQELDQMLAPIALYPDALLSQILMAATYPAEVVEAAQWSRRNPGLDGDRAVRAVDRMDWDPSVKSLVAFPQILALMDEKLDWTGRLGDAFYAQQADVMDSVQYLRQKAYLAGNLGSTEQLRVDRQGQAIVIELANPEVIYVPYYNPAVVYGTWWWPTYQPIHWASWPGYYVRPGFARGFAWGPGIRVSNVWQHNPVHRRDVPYRQASLHQPAGHTSAAPEARRETRGPDPSAFDSRGRPVNRADARSAASRPNAPAKAGRPNGEPRHAADGAGHRADTRKPDGRGPASHQATPSGDRPAPVSQPTGKAAATTVSDSVSAPQPAANARGNGRKPRDQ